MPDTSNPNTQIVVVSAFIHNINQRGDRNVDKYIEYGKKLVGIHFLPKVVFIERETYSKYWGETTPEYVVLDASGVGSCAPEGRAHSLNYYWEQRTQTLFVFFEKSQMYLYQHKDEITEFALETSNPSKDTVEYMFIQCYKTEWMRLAIHLVEALATRDNIKTLDGDAASSSPFKFPANNQYVWMDFGLYHMFGNDDAAFVSQMANLDVRVKSRFRDACANGHPFNTVYFASCWNHTHYYHLDIYTQIHWVFAGSVFGGYRAALLEFADKMKDECLRTIREKKHLMWEVNVWYLIYRQCPHFFDFYSCDHNETILSHY